MKITASVVGLLSNAEVAQALHDRGAHGLSLDARAKPSEKLAYHYLLRRQQHIKPRKALEDFREAAKALKLQRMEIFHIINICPTLDGELDPLMDHTDEARLNGALYREIEDAVRLYLLPQPTS